MGKLNLSIPDPCNEDWSKMTQEEKGRFCSSCKKTVIDFTGMSDRELIAFFKKPSGSLCGRFNQEQLDRDVVISRKRIPGIKYFFQFVLPAFLISLKASSQEEQTKGKVAVVCTREVKGDTLTIIKPLPEEAVYEIRGRIIDKNGLGVSNASIVIKGTQAGAVCDSAGYFKIKKSNTGLVLVASSVGFVSKEFVVNDLSFTQVVLNEVLLSGEVVVAGMIATKPSKPVPLIKKAIDTAFSHVSIYPNPVPLNSAFSINTKKLEKADYIISILRMNGEVIQSRMISVNGKNQVITFQLEKMVSGNYFIQLLNRSSGKTFTGKLIVQ